MLFDYDTTKIISYKLICKFFLFDKNIEFYKKGDYNICVVQ